MSDLDELEDYAARLKPDRPTRTARQRSLLRKIDRPMPAFSGYRGKGTIRSGRADAKLRKF